MTGSEDVMFDILFNNKNFGEAIEAQEKRGQNMVVASELLPRRMQSSTKEDYEALGIVFYEVADDLFWRVSLPSGWQKIATDHSMWSKVVDETGRERISVFYKAAFYDRDAFMRIVKISE